MEWPELSNAERDWTPEWLDAPAWAPDELLDLADQWTADLSELGRYEGGGTGDLADVTGVLVAAALARGLRGEAATLRAFILTGTDQRGAVVAVAVLRDVLQAELAERVADSDGGTPDTDDTGRDRPTAGEVQDKCAEAVRLLVNDHGLTTTEIADRVGLDRSTLYRSKSGAAFRRAKAMRDRVAAEQRQERATGYMTDTGPDAVDNTDPTDIDDPWQ